MKVLSSTHTILILVGASLLDRSLAFSPQGCRASGMPTKIRSVLLNAVTNGHESATMETSSINRRDAVRRTLTTLIGGTVASTALVPSAHADVTNKVASSTALRALTRAQTQLPTKLLPDVQANNFIGVKARLREPPFDLVRKNALTLVRGGEDGPRAKELVTSYKALIATLEKIDGTASLGMRGRTVGDLQMTQEYDDIVAALAAFLKVGAEAAEIPLQEQPSLQENLRTGSIETKVLTGE